MASSDWTFILVLPFFQLGEPCRELENGGASAIGVHGGNNAQISVKQALRAQKTRSGTRVAVSRQGFKYFFPLFFWGDINGKA